MGDRTDPRKTLSFVPPLFLVFLVSDLLLSYGPWPFPLRAVLFLMGVVLPMVLFTRRPLDPRKQEDLVRTEVFLPTPAWVWAVLFAAAIALRFFKIESLSVWPTGDEGLKGMAAISLADHWDWRFFYTVGQNPPAFIWLTALFFKATSHPLFNLWAPAALVSCATLLAGFAAIRSFASRSFTLTFTALMAFSFWPLYLGRRCLPAVLPPLGEFLVLFCLVRFLKAKKHKTLWALLTGLLLGLQSFTYVSWPVVFLAGAVVFFHLWGKEGKGKDLGVFGLGALLGSIPFLLALYREGYGQHILALTQGSAWFKYGGFLERCHRYLEAFLFRSPGRGGELGEPGGLLNPVLGAFFLLGLAHAVRSRHLPFYRFLGAAFLLFLLPGIFSLNLQSFRVVQVLPLLLGVTALGLSLLARGVPSKGRLPLLLLLLSVSVGSDLLKLTRPYREAARDPSTLDVQGRSSVRYRTYQEWEATAKRLGPGILLSEWDLFADRTLAVVAQPFNACREPRLDPNKARWLGILVDARYGPFLPQAFPRAQWKDMGRDLTGQAYLLGFLEIGEGDREKALRWAKADAAFQAIDWAVDHALDKDVLARTDSAIQKGYPTLQGDRLLESLYWEKVAEFYYYLGGNEAENLRALELALARGVPAPHLQAKLAGLRSILQKEKASP